MSDPTAPSATYRAILRKLLPTFILKERGIYMRLGRRAGAAYVRLRLTNALGWKGSIPMVPKSSRSFLFVCFGNIMRSPMAEALLKRELMRRGVAEPVKIASAGLHATSGNIAHAWALAASADFNISLENHRAQLITQEMAHAADAIFAMDFQNKAELLALFPDCKHKIFMLSSCLRGTGQHREISDPYFGDVDSTRACYRTLQLCIQNLADDLFTPVDDRR
jgi:protein-tyrosine-phosphatase